MDLPTQIEEPDHKRMARGVWIPMEIWERFESNSLNDAQLKVLMFIDSLVDSKGIGCWASNQYLATKLNMTPNHISSIIRFLKGEQTDKEGNKISDTLVIQAGWVTVQHLKYRILETIWSRILLADEDESIEEAQSRIEASIKSLTKGKSVKVELDPDVFRNRNGRVMKIRKGTLTRIRKEMNTSYRSIEGDRGIENSHPPLNYSSKKNKSESISSKGFLDHPQECYEWNDRLRKILHSRRPKWPVQEYQRKTGAKEFARLLKAFHGDKEKIETQLTRLSECINNISKPTIVSAKQFCKLETFLWLKDVMDKLQGVVSIENQNIAEW